MGDRKSRSLSTRGAAPLDYSDSIRMLYAVENPSMRNVKGNTVRSFNDGYAGTIGPGVADTSGADPKWFTGKPVSKREVDAFAVKHLRKSDEIIRRAYDDMYGTPNFPHPSDTISQTHRLLVAQNRYQRGSLGKGTNSILSALANGRRSRVVNAVGNNTPNWDKDRHRRVKEFFKIK